MVVERYKKVDTGSEEELFEAFFEICATSFPASEQKPKEAIRMLFGAKEYSLFLARDQHLLVGFCVFYHSYENDFCLLEYMAVAEKFRNSGVGTKLFLYSIDTLLTPNQERPILIEVDSPKEKSNDRVQRERRMRFYQKVGCKRIDGFEYILGLRSSEVPPKMELMIHSKDTWIAKSRLQKYVEAIYIGVYKREHGDANIAKMFGNMPEIMHLT